MAQLSFPTHFKIVQGICPTACTGTVTADNISMKDAHKVWIVVNASNITGKANVINPLLGTAVASCTTAITFSAPNWYTYSTTATDTLTEGTAGTTVTMSANATPAIYIIEIDPQLAAAQGATYDCLGCTITGGNQAADFESIMYIIEPRYKQATPPSAIID